MKSEQMSDITSGLQCLPIGASFRLTVITSIAVLVTNAFLRSVLVRLPTKETAGEVKNSSCGFALMALVILSACGGNNEGVVTLSKLEPEVSAPGRYLTIFGAGFSPGGDVVFASGKGVKPVTTTSSKIIVKIPDFANSGGVTYNIGSQQSNKLQLQILDQRKFSGAEPNKFALGADHFCVIYGIASELVCYGSNVFGELGSGYAGSTSGPVRLGPGWEQVVAGYHHSCGLKDTGELLCWGWNEDNQVGVGAGEVQNNFGQRIVVTSSSLYNKRDWIHISARASHSCAVDASGYVLCWGDVDSPRYSSFSKVLSWQRSFSGWLHVCVLSSYAEASCWGSNSHGQLGPAVDTLPTDWVD